MAENIAMKKIWEILQARYFTKNKFKKLPKRTARTIHKGGYDKDKRESKCKLKLIGCSFIISLKIHPEKNVYYKCMSEQNRAKGGEMKLYW